jgi:hypothetical protein
MDQETIIPSQQAVSAQGSNLEEQHNQIAQLQKITSISSTSA